MKVTRIIHLRAPLLIRNFLGKREVEPTVVPDRAGYNGGATIVLSGDLDNPGLVQMQVAWCRYTDNYARKLGVKTAKAKDPEAVHLRSLNKVLMEVEDQMLCQVSPYLRHNIEQRDLCKSEFHHVVRSFLPLQQKPEVKNAE